MIQDWQEGTSVEKIPSTFLEENCNGWLSTSSFQQFEDGNK